jgi:amidase
VRRRGVTGDVRSPVAKATYDLRSVGPEASTSTFIRRFATEGDGLRLAVKDLIDMKGEVTTAGCRAVASTASPAVQDARCLSGSRHRGVRVVGRTNLHELGLGVTGVNPWYGTPTNPIDATRVPGGSSSGSAVAVAERTADVAFGTDTGGSVRIPAACCGVAGLKTTHGRVPLEGVWPLAPSFDTVGPIARTIPDLAAGMSLLEPGFVIDSIGRPAVARLRVPCDPLIDEAIDGALHASGWTIKEVEDLEWVAASATCLTILLAEAWASNRHLAVEQPHHLGADTLERLALGRDTDAHSVSSCWKQAARWTRHLSNLFETFDFLVSPTITIVPPTIERAADLKVPTARCTLPVNLAGVPALAMPVPSRGPMPASLQIVGPMASEERLLAAALDLERSISASPHQVGPTLRGGEPGEG